MRLLELFTGTGSVGHAFRTHGWEVISLDKDPKTDATTHEDILTWDHTIYPPGHFDAIWASPDCTQYSNARRGAKTPRNLVLADSLVERSLALITYFAPRAWFVENPQTGMLKGRPFMAGLPFVDVDYCCYGAKYKKRTRIWTNVSLAGRLCPGPNVCPHMVGRRHVCTAQQGRNRDTEGCMYGFPFQRRDLHRIPELLCGDIVSACS